MKYCFGIDIGGTTVKIGLFTTEGELLEKWEIKTRTENHGEAILPDVAESLQNKMQEKNIRKSEVDGIGIGIPAPVMEDGVVQKTANLGWGYKEVTREMKELTGLPVAAGNDANMAALGEMWLGAGKGQKNMIMVTLGTGVGGGIIVNGKPLAGSHGAGGEIGHFCVNEEETETCGCGNTGCLEAFASGPSIVQLAKEYLSGGKSAKFEELANGREITPFMVYEAAMQGDAVAKRIFAIVGEWLGIALTSVVNLLNPEKIIIGGGVSQAGNFLIDPIRKTINERAIKVSADAVEVVTAKLGERAGVIGASLLIDNK